MHQSVINLNNIQNLIKANQEKTNNKSNIKIIAVSKTFEISHITPLIEYGHRDFGENKVQEAIEKWTNLKNKKSNLRLHLIGKLQTNKTKHAVKIFDYIHSLDNEKLAKKISDEEIKQGKKIKIFIQVNIGDENQKAGIPKNQISEFYTYCKKLNLNVIGLMCIPPYDKDPSIYFKEMKIISKNLNLKELSMGMSSDFLNAIDYFSSYLRIGSGIFGKRGT